MKDTINPDTGKVEKAEWIDDHFGMHMYGIRFKSGEVFREEDIKQDITPTEQPRL